MPSQITSKTIAMLTKGKLISDVKLQLSQGVVSDDYQLEDSQIAFWASHFLNALSTQDIMINLSAGNNIPPIYIVREDSLPIQVESVPDLDPDNQRVYITLSRDVLELSRDRGLVNVWDYNGQLIHKASIDTLYMLSTMRYTKPTADNKLYYRSGKKIFIYGFGKSELPYNKIIVDYVPKQDLMTMSDTDEILITDHLIPQLIALVVHTGKLQMYGTTPDVSNDGIDLKSPAYHLGIQKPIAMPGIPEAGTTDKGDDTEQS